jgi:prepilin signal peptidase PulO-like enzyme (type II secretory pathway)
VNPCRRANASPNGQQPARGIGQPETTAQFPDWASWSALLAGTCLGWAYAVVSRLALLATHKVNRDARIPFGMFLITGALAALLRNATT